MPQQQQGQRSHQSGSRDKRGSSRERRPQSVEHASHNRATAAMTTPENKSHQPSAKSSHSNHHGNITPSAGGLSASQDTPKSSHGHRQREVPLISPSDGGGGPGPSPHKRPTGPSPRNESIRASSKERPISSHVPKRLFDDGKGQSSPALKKEVKVEVKVEAPGPRDSQCQRDSLKLRMPAGKVQEVSAHRDIQLKIRNNHEFDRTRYHTQFHLFFCVKYGYFDALLCGRTMLM